MGGALLPCRRLPSACLLLARTPTRLLSPLLASPLPPARCCIAIVATRLIIVAMRWPGMPAAVAARAAAVRRLGELPLLLESEPTSTRVHAAQHMLSVVHVHEMCAWRVVHRTITRRSRCMLALLGGDHDVHHNLWHALVATQRACSSPCTRVDCSVHLRQSAPPRDLQAPRARDQRLV